MIQLYYHIKMSHLVALVIFILLSFEYIEHTTGLSRQKRCIVIQKQSGTHGDSTEGEDDRLGEPRERPEIHHTKRPSSRHDLHDAEEISPQFLRYKAGPTKKLNDLFHFKNKLISFKRM